MTDLLYRTEHVIKNELNVTRHQLQRNDIGGLDETLRWLSWLEGDLHKLVWLRVWGVQWWRLELRRWLLRVRARRYDRKTLAFYFRRGVEIICHRLDEAEDAASG